jgi:hypothetical protein
MQGERRLWSDSGHLTISQNFPDFRPESALPQRLSLGPKRSHFADSDYLNALWEVPFGKVFQNFD